MRNKRDRFLSQSQTAPCPKQPLSPTAPCPKQPPVPFTVGVFQGEKTKGLLDMEAGKKWLKEKVDGFKDK